MLVHFINCAKPNEDLYVDEFVMFLVAFPILDFAWRLGGQMPLARALDTYTGERDALAMVNQYKDKMIARGFPSQRASLDRAILIARANKYAQAYELDRREQSWIYQRTRTLLAKNCLSPLAAAGARLIFCRTHCGRLIAPSRSLSMCHFG